MKNIFAVDIGGSKLICGIVTPQGEVLATHRTDFSGPSTIEEVLAAIKKGYDALAPKDVTHCGAAIPGLCDAKNGTWLYSPFSGLENIQIAKLINEITGLKTFVDNDVNLCALAEGYFGLCNACDNYLWLTVSNGIGGGLFLNGNLFRGKNYNAGEIGHIIVEENSQNLCGCGNYGCLEAVASGASISKTHAKITGKKLSAKEIAVLAKQGEPQALLVYQQAGQYIGKAVAHATNLLGLEKIILGGGVVQDFDLFENAIKDSFNKYVFKKANPETEILASSLGYFAALKGCAAVVLYETK